ncbi:hypothetical protein TIFTF001_005800 [Ficus carica]|uniref:Calcineurin-like phosphoesterase domain-containing protein n=1 Tax=Ficus carica TaxID=3494 RepID=A0AA88CVB3_FICCA|nr:hypothetical protein TIFTF001_005800 [Ficus carica]
MEDHPRREECREIPKLVSSFVDTFVDFSVSGGLFLLPNPNPNSNHNPLRTQYPAADRLIAIGDLHGDLEKTRQSLRLAGLVDAADKWIGGSTTVVQIGDVLDRGGEELKILYFIEKLRREAARCGGEIISMNGNHEIMNVEGDFRFVTKEGLEEFKIWADWYSIGREMKSLCDGLEKNPRDLFEGIPHSFNGVKSEFSEGFRARIAALRPSGPISSRFLSRNVTVLVIGDSVFVHGGLLPSHVSYGLDRINDEVRDWIVNGSSQGRRYSPGYCRGRNAVVWLRSFSDESPAKCDCEALEHVLATIPGAKRMIMGHTIQQVGINGVCDDRAIRIDVGMSKGCIDGLPEVLEIKRSEEVRILTSNPVYFKSSTAVVEAEGGIGGRREGLGLLLPENGPKQVEVKA